MAIAGLKDVTTGDTLCDEKAPIVLERMEFPDPVIKVLGAPFQAAVAGLGWDLGCSIPGCGS